MHSSRMRTARSSRCQEGSASVYAGIHTPRCGPGDLTPPRCGPGDPPDPSTSLLGVGLETPPRPDPSTSPLGVGLETCKACWDTTPPPVNRITDMCKNITLPQLRAGGKNIRFYLSVCLHVALSADWLLGYHDVMLFKDCHLKIVEV